MNDWISIRDRLPEEPQKVTVCDAPNKAWCAGYWFGGTNLKPWSWKNGDVVDITHWLPIPDLPKAEPPLPFSYKCEGTWGPWAVFHTARGKICHFPERMQAEATCDTLNKMWQIEQEDQLSKPAIPQCPRCDIALSFVVVNKPTTSHTYWECPRCGKETHPIEETEERGQCKDCRYWGWYDDGVIRTCQFHEAYAKDTDTCEDFRKKGANDNLFHSMWTILVCERRSGNTDCDNRLGTHRGSQKEKGS